MSENALFSLCMWEGTQPLLFVCLKRTNHTHICLQREIGNFKADSLVKWADDSSIAAIILIG